MPSGSEDAVGFVLAGGRSSRMGADKALVEFRGQPLVVHALGILRDAGLEATISGARSALGGFAQVVPDTVPGAGPLGGICAAMAATEMRWSVFISIDQPFLPPSLLRCLLDRACRTGNAITVPSMTGFAETFPAVLDRAALPWLQSELDSGCGGCFAAYKSAASGLRQEIDVVEVEALSLSGQASHPAGLPATSWLTNINSVEDLRRAEEQLPGFFA